MFIRLATGIAAFRTYINFVGPLARGCGRVATRAVRAAGRVVGTANGLRHRAASPSAGYFAAL